MADETNYIKKLTTYTVSQSRTVFTSYVKDSKSPVPDNAIVVGVLTPDMKDKIIYIVPKKGSKQGLKCRIVEVVPVINRPKNTSQNIKIEIIEKGVILKLNDSDIFTIHNAMIQDRILLENPIQSNAVSAEAAQGGRRKRARRTKRALCRRRRTHRK